jgi:predicted ATP-grasp superfamily ATP-dependent carboligase
MEDGSFVTTDQIREAADRLNTALKAIAEGTLKPDREKDELTYALGTP